MTYRICDGCGNNKDVKGGKTCASGHFVCQTCLGGGIFSDPRRICPLCQKELR